MTIPDAAIVTALGAIGTFIGGAMKLMWDALKRDHDAVRADNVELRSRIEVQEKRSDECEADRRELHRQQNALKTALAGALACANADCQVRKRIAETFSLQ